MNKRSVRAFTFMELLIAFTIFAVIAASIYYTLGAGIRVYRRGNSVIKDNQKLRIFFNTISEDMRNALPYSDEKKGFYLESEWLEDAVSFPTLINVFGKERMAHELARVSYYMEEERGEKKILRKRQVKESGFDEEHAEEEVLLHGLEDFDVEDFAFEYCYEITGFEDEYEWRKDTEFDEDVPRGVKIILTLKNKNRKTEEVFRKTVYVPRGTLGSDRK